MVKALVSILRAGEDGAGGRGPSGGPVRAPLGVTCKVVMVLGEAFWSLSGGKVPRWSGSEKVISATKQSQRAEGWNAGGVRSRWRAGMVAPPRRVHGYVIALFGRCQVGTGRKLVRCGRVSLGKLKTEG
jgi:hypothetical protein